MVREIEIKAKVKDLDSVIILLKKSGCTLSSPLHQEDTIYFEKGKDPINKELSDPVLRIRRVGGKAIFTYKHSNSQDLDKTEYETEVSNPDSLNEIILLLGFIPQIVVEKTRIETKYKGFTLCLDKVKGLGEFIEIEKIVDESAEKMQEKMRHVLKEFKVVERDIVLESYDKTLWRNKVNLN